MFKKIIHFFFFGNYFIGLLAIALNIETAFQLKLSFNSVLYYMLIGILPIVYYTYAYSNAHNFLKPHNLRVLWYKIYHNQIILRQKILLIICCLLSLVYLFYFHQNFKFISFFNWAQLIIIISIIVFYYGILPKSNFNKNLRSKGWLKSLIIGFSWACCASFMPLWALKLEMGMNIKVNNYLWIWLFINNFIFCSINAIIFDIKDYQSDANKHLNTYVVRFGLRKTILYIIQPLILLSCTSFFIFSFYQGFSIQKVLINLLPFLGLFVLSYRMFKRRSILYYLIVVDGLILFKAICGIVGSYF